MKRSVFILFATVIVALGLSAGAARATGQGNDAINKWKSMDKCARQAQLAYPDFTPDSNAKRDAALQNCLNAGNLPPREPLAPPAPH
jgi:hypothetical protein